MKKIIFTIFVLILSKNFCMQQLDRELKSLILHKYFSKHIETDKSLIQALKEITKLESLSREFKDIISNQEFITDILNEYLVKYGKDSYNIEFLNAIKEINNLKIITKMISVAKIDINTPINNIYPLIWAVKNKKNNIVKLLLLPKYKTNINVVDKSRDSSDPFGQKANRNALMIAIDNQDIEIIKNLLSRADRNTLLHMDNNFETALDLAKKKSSEIYNLVNQKYKDLNTQVTSSFSDTNIVFM